MLPVVQSNFKQRLGAQKVLSHFSAKAETVQRNHGPNAGPFLNPVAEF